MNSSTKYTYPLFESICVFNGIIQNTEFHIQRFQNAFQKFYWEAPRFGLFDGIEIPKEFQQGKVKLRISYGETSKKHTLSPYTKKKVETLKLVVDDSIDYDLKFEERSQLTSLFQLREHCDDVLIIKNGRITDSSYANIAFWDGRTWHTPTSYLLRGTKRSQLVQYGHIQETTIGINDFGNFQGFQLINAMLDFEPDFFLPIQNIVR